MTSSSESLDFAARDLRNTIATSAGPGPVEQGVDEYYSQRVSEAGQDVAHHLMDKYGAGAITPAMRECVQLAGQAIGTDMAHRLGDVKMLAYALMLHIHRTTGMVPDEALAKAVLIAREEGDW